MYAERLERMAALLERDAADDKGVVFNLGVWAVPTEEVNLRSHAAAWSEPQEMVPVSCGTTACAMGLAAISGEFKAEGLEAGYMPNHRGDGFILVPQIAVNAAYKQTGFDAAVALFGITGSDAQYLFDPDCYLDTPKGAEGELFVAERIRNFVAGIIDDNYHNDSRDSYELDDDDDEQDEGED